MKSLISSLYINQLIFINIILFNIGNAVSYEISSVNGSTCPRIITREEWRASNALHTDDLISPVSNVIIHHTVEFDYCHNIHRCSKIVRAYQRYDMHYRHLNDIGFNFLIGEDGNVYEGRGWNYRGMATGEIDHYSINIAVIGNYNYFTPIPRALEALRNFIECGVSSNKISEDYALLAHSKFNTSCPGDSFYTSIQRMPHFTQTPIIITNLNQTAVPTPKPNKSPIFRLLLQSAANFQSVD